MNEQLRLWKTRGKTLHVLSKVDRDARTAYCDHCGETKVYFNSKNGSAQCAEAAKARARAKKK